MVHVAVVLFPCGIMAIAILSIIDEMKRGERIGIKFVIVAHHCM